MRFIRMNSSFSSDIMKDLLKRLIVQNYLKNILILTRLSTLYRYLAHKNKIVYLFKKAYELVDCTLRSEY